MDLLKELLMGTRRTRKKQRIVEQRIRDGLCLCDGCDRSHREPGSARGRCAKHYQAFKMRVRNLPIEQSMAITMREIRAGTLLDNQEIRRLAGAPTTAKTA